MQVENRQILSTMYFTLLALVTLHTYLVIWYAVMEKRSGVRAFKKLNV